MIEAWKYSELEYEKNLSLTDEKIVFETKDSIVFKKLEKNEYTKIKRRYTDSFTELNDELWTHGVLIKVKKNEKALAKNIFSNEKKGSVIQKTVIVLEENSELDYIEEHEKGKEEFFRNSSIEIYLGNNSKLNFHNYQEWNSKVKSIANWTAFLENDSKAMFFFSQFGSMFSRIKIDAYLKKGSEAVMKGIFFSKDEQKFDFTTNLNHEEQGTLGNILVKGALKDKSKSVFRGMIKILKAAQQTNSYLSDHSLLLSEDARSYSIPSLEIDANDVKASHGATLGKPDEEEIFYLMARGLDRAKAQKIMIKGYFAPVLEGINYLNEKIDLSIENV